MKVRFDHSQPAAKDIITFWFDKPQSIHHVAGQFIELYLPHAPDERGERHWFTLSSSPTEDKLAITTKFSRESSSFKTTLKNLKPGAEVDMAEPMGDFVLPKDSSIPLVFVAGGIGCTPFRSIIKWLQDGGHRRDIKLFYAAASVEEMAFKDIFSRLGSNFRPIIGPNLTAAKIVQTTPQSQKSHIYLSGPEKLVESLRKDFITAGQDKKFVYTDFFHGYLDI